MTLRFMNDGPIQSPLPSRQGGCGSRERTTTEWLVSYPPRVTGGVATGGASSLASVSAKSSLQYETPPNRRTIRLSAATDKPNTRYPSARQLHMNKCFKYACHFCAP